MSGVSLYLAFKRNLAQHPLPLTLEDWLLTVEYRDCLLQTGHSRLQVLVSNAAAISMAPATAIGHKRVLVGVGFRVGQLHAEYFVCRWSRLGPMAKRTKHLCSISRDRGIHVRDSRKAMSSSLAAGVQRIVLQQNKIEELKASKAAPHEKFVRWQYNADKYGRKQHQLNKELPRIDRERTDN